MCRRLPPCRAPHLAATFLACACAVATAADWPTWRCDPNRSGSTAERLPARLHLQWSLRLPALEPAWPDEPRMRFDRVYQPVVAGQTLFVGSSHDDCVRALDVRNGGERWRFYANGPVRFAPVAWKDRLFVASDDGRLYCLDAETGRVRWQVRGGPSDRRVLGNERLISMWPVRGGPVVRDGTVYFAAGIWPFMGVFLYALDAETGRVEWCNDGAGAMYLSQPHNSSAFAGIAPQGYLAAAGDRLLVPNGRAAAAGFDRATGRFAYFHHAATKSTGHCEAAVTGEHFLNSGKLRKLSDGLGSALVGPAGENVITRCSRSATVYYDTVAEEEIAPVGKIGVLHGATYYQSAGDILYAEDLSAPVKQTWVDSRGRKQQRKGFRRLWELATRARPMLRAGERLYAAGRREVVALDLPAREAVREPVKRTGPTSAERMPPPNVSWSAATDETPAAMIAAAGRLIVVTAEGGLLCYGGSPAAEPPDRNLRDPHAADPNPAERAGDAVAADLLRAAGASEGYCLVLGLADGRLAEALARRSRLRVIAIDADADKVNALRRRIDRARLPGRRLAAIVADPAAASLPPYLASLIVSERGAGLPIRELFGMLRPYGGAICLPRSAAPGADLDGLAGCERRRTGRWELVVRRGPLPGAGSWTHQYGNPSNTCVSPDERVKAPLGLLWFGGVSNAGILPRHGHGPPEQVIGGRLFIEGPDLLRALDVYTGRTLWERYLPGVGESYNNTSHEPGANALGTNFVAAPDAVYVIHDRQCLVLDPATGKTRRELRLPGGGNSANSAPDWGYLGVWEDLLVAGSSPMRFWTPRFAREQFGKLDRKTRKQKIDPKDLAALTAAVRAWRDFEPAELPKAALVLPPPREIGAKPPAAEAPGELDSLVANLNKMIRRTDLLATLPDDVLTTARLREAKVVAAWDRARRLDDYFAQPKPETIDDLTALAAELEAAGRAELPDGRSALMLRRQVLERCYPALPRAERRPAGSFTLDRTASREIVVMDRRTGKVLWRRPAAASFRHNAICLGGEMLFCIDRMPTDVTRRMLRRGIRPGAADTLLALDLRTGKERWRATGAIFGTWVSYSGDHDVLLQAARPSRDMLADEPATRMIAYRGRTGKVLWDRKDTKFRFGGPVMLHGRTIITQGAAMDLLTGEARTRRNPLTGETMRWEFQRNYGCNTVVASRHLLTFRSAAAGFFDLQRDGGTGNLGGFKSSCTSNLVVADGVLNAPDYTRTCTCSYQNQSSLALIHMPEVEMWTFQDFGRGKGPIRRAGINFGAPGDRKADGGTLWLEYPYVGGPTPKVEVAVRSEAGGKPLDTKALDKLTFRRHSSRIRGEGLAWVAASGIEAAGQITLKLAGSKDPPRAYTVSLHFAEPGPVTKGERVFQVTLQGKTVLKALDVAAEAGAPLTPLVRTFPHVSVRDELTVTLAPTAATRHPPILCGIEVIAEKP